MTNPVFEKLQSIIVEGPARARYLDDSDIVEVRYRNIILSYPVADPRFDLAGLLAAINRMGGIILERLGLDLGQVEIEIFQDRDQWQEKHTQVATDLPSWVAGDSGRVIRIVLTGKDISFSELQLMVSHECVHLAVCRHTMGRVPAWLDEGLAVFLCQNLPPVYRQALAEALATDSLLPFDLLDRPFTLLDRALKTLAYAQACSLVSFLIARSGLPMIRELLAAFARGERLDAALRSHGLNGYLLEKEWLPWASEELAR